MVQKAWLTTNSILKSRSFCLLLKALDTFGNCQRPVFSLGVSKHNMRKITLCESLDSYGHRRCQRKTKEKTPLMHKLVCFQMPKNSFRLEVLSDNRYA